MLLGNKRDGLCVQTTMKRIKHSAEVVGVEPGLVRVAIVASGACHACRAKELCGMGESQQKIIEVRTADSESYRPGEQVEVSEEQQMAFRALLIAYVGAFLVLIVVLILLLQFNCSEGTAALGSLLGVLLYYGCIYLFRDRIEQKIYFTITKQ